jgi:hypothetical protein
MVRKYLCDTVFSHFLRFLLNSSHHYHHNLLTETEVVVSYTKIDHIDTLIPTDPHPTPPRTANTEVFSIIFATVESRNNYSTQRQEKVDAFLVRYGHKMQYKLFKILIFKYHVFESSGILATFLSTSRAWAAITPTRFRASYTTKPSYW